MQRPLPAARKAGDAAIIDLIRLAGDARVADLACSLGVTGTAIRVRLDRLERDGIVEKVPADPLSRRGRGRPATGYRLTAQGRLTGGDNFHDLAMALWEEVRGIRDPSVRRGLIGRIGRRLAVRWESEIDHQTPLGRLEQVAGLLRERSVSCSVASDSGGLPVLTSHSCPYPELADRDRGICAAERRMLEHLTGASVRLTECRLDGDACCRFTASAAPTEADPSDAAEDGGSARIEAGRPRVGPGLASGDACASNPGTFGAFSGGSNRPGGGCRNHSSRRRER